MEDSFFGFDTTGGLDDEGGGRIAEPSEEEYDALNDETFGAAINGDWEEVHENLVRLTDNHNGDSMDRDGLVAKGSSCIVDIFDNSRQRSAGSSKIRASTEQQRVVHNRTELDSDLEINFSGMKLDDVDITFDDGDSILSNSGINVNPNVWSHNILCSTNNQAHNLPTSRSKTSLGERFSTSLERQQQQQPYINTMHMFPKDMNTYKSLHDLQEASKPPKICTLEDIERSIIIQQTLQKQQQKNQHCKQVQRMQEQKDMGASSEIKPLPKDVSSIQQQDHQTNSQIQQQMQMQQQPLINKSQQHMPVKGPPGFNPMLAPARSAINFSNYLPHHPLGNVGHQPQPAMMSGSRLPPGFPSMPMYQPGISPHLQQTNHLQRPSHPLLNQHSLPPNFLHQHQRPLPNPHLPIALNNFAMHPNFNAMRAATAAVMHPNAMVQQQQPQPRMPPNATSLLNHYQSNSMFNLYNMRLVQEIQQNHPLLQSASRQQQLQYQQNLSSSANALNNMHFLQQQHQQQQQRGFNKQNNHYQHHRRSDGGVANGNLPPEDFDEYANLMSTRDKHWLIGIQLSQLITDTPYIDDYYYTVHNERKMELDGSSHSQAHKDNQLNHPLTQPKGHAQLVLMHLGQKNGVRNGQHRERRNSETAATTNEQKPIYVFTPIKIENSLGKLQYGSVNAPRKMIDIDFVGGEANENVQYKTTKPTSVENNEVVKIKGKYCHILLHIESMYRMVLKLEDLDNPKMVENMKLKQKKEMERLAALEQLENANKANESNVTESNNSQSSTQPDAKVYQVFEIEKKEDLIPKLLAGLTHDTVTAMMNVQKGKTLLLRVMPYVRDNGTRWIVWSGVFASLQKVMKKDNKDLSGSLYALYPELRTDIETADFGTIVQLATMLPFNEKKPNILCSKFTVSALVCLIEQAEKLYITTKDTKANSRNKDTWRQFLNNVAASVSRTIQNRTICVSINSESIQKMVEHFSRFKDLKLDSILAYIKIVQEQSN